MTDKTMTLEQVLDYLRFRARYIRKESQPEHRMLQCIDAITRHLSQPAEQHPDPNGCNDCTHPDCGRFDGPAQVECRAMQRNACAREQPAERGDSQEKAAPVAEVYKGAFGIHYIGCPDPQKLSVGTKLYTAPPPAAGVPDVRLDAENWGKALNEAAWEFVDTCPEKSALLFNHAKTSLRTAILKYLDIVSATPSPTIDVAACGACFGTGEITDQNGGKHKCYYGCAIGDASRG